MARLSSVLLAATLLATPVFAQSVQGQEGSGGGQGASGPDVVAPAPAPAAVGPAVGPVGPAIPAVPGPAAALAPAPAQRIPAQAAPEAAPEAAPRLSPIEMFHDADIVVQSVMAGLIGASVLIWAIWLGKLLQLAAAKGKLRRAQRHLGAQGADLASVKLGRVPLMMLACARAEVAASHGLPNAGTMERVASELSSVELSAQRRLQSGVALIGTVAATAPFIGLFGTVWGIMNSFIGIAATKTTSLAVVAPGIAEALLATGIGLVAAIPAVIFYNHLARSLAAHRALLAEVARKIAVQTSRDLDRADLAPAGPRALAAE